MEEIWKFIPNFNDVYMISDKGNIKNLKTKKNLKMSIKGGYRYVCLRDMYGNISKKRIMKNQKISKI